MSKKTVSLRKKLLLLMDFFLIIMLAFSDYLGKLFVTDYLKGKGSYIIIDNVLQLTYKENDGGFFGFLKNQQLFILFICSIFILMVVVVLIKLPDTPKFNGANLALSFILAGSVANFYDRIMHDCIIDYIYFISIDFPVFNLADFYLVVGTLIIILLLIFKYREMDLDFLKFKKAYYREL